MEHWELDLDQKDFETYLMGNDFSSAEAIYVNGGNSMKTTYITVDPLVQNFLKGAKVEQGAARGDLSADAATGDTLLKVGITSTCVGEAASATDKSGCFKDDGGPLTIDGVAVGSQISVNLRIRTLAKFSVGVDGKMAGYEMFDKYKAYYGVSDYADKFITAALKGQDETSASVPMNFVGKDNTYRIECAKKGSAYWSVWMYMIWEMEDAIADCNDNCDPGVDNCNDAPVHAWDEAWAFYTGSLEGKYGNAAGIFPYRLAENLCKKFKTCLGGKSAVNRELEDNFLDGKDKLDQGQCDEAKSYKKGIMTAMTIPLIQGTLHSCYKISQGDTSSKAMAEGVSFVGAILPQLHECSAADAEIVKNHMWIDGNMNASNDGFKTCKEAIERNYACMGMKCADIGGAVDDQTGGYLQGFEPCTD